MDETWKLDTVVSFDSVFYFQDWSPQFFYLTDQSKCARKTIYVEKGFWFWQNTYCGEADFYERQLNIMQKEVFMVLYDHRDATWSFKLDTLDTELKREIDYIKSEKELKQSLEYGLIYLCDGSDADSMDVFPGRSISMEEGFRLMEARGLLK